MSTSCHVYIYVYTIYNMYIIYRTVVHSAKGYTLFDLVYGFQSTLPSTLREAPSPQYNYDDSVMESNSRLQTAHDVAKQKLVTA